MISAMHEFWLFLASIQWRWPMVFLLLPLPYLLRLWLPESRRTVVYPRVPFIDELRQTSVSESRIAGGRAEWLRLLLMGLIWVLVLAAAARPQWLGEPVEIPVSGRDLMLAVDISGSMETRDFNISGTHIDRITATKAVVSAFLKKREGDRVGLILFGSQAYVQVPLTFDHETVRILLNEAVIGLAGKETAIGDAIGLTVKRLMSASEKNNASQDGHSKTDQVLILLTDGVNNAGEVTPESAADMAARQGMKIYTIGVGASNMTVSSLFGQQQVNPSTDLDEDTLKAIARKTGGKYFRAHDTRELLSIYSMIDELEPVERDKEIYRPVKALYMWPLGTAWGLTLLLLLSCIAWERLRL